MQSLVDAVLTQRHSSRETERMARMHVPTSQLPPSPPGRRHDLAELVKEGTRFGRWRVTETPEVDGAWQTFVAVQCDCGVQRKVRLGALLYKNSHGCRACTRAEAREREWDR